MKTPKNRRTLGIFILLTWLAAPVVETAYYNIELSRGTFPLDADSISIPIFQFLIGWLIASPFIAGISYWVLKHYTPSVPITTWNKKRPIWTSFITGLFFVFLLLEGKFLVKSMIGFNILDVVYTVVLIFLAALIRAAVVTYNQKDTPDQDPVR